jgi:YVTN family beta-propeller protein
MKKVVLASLTLTISWTAAAQTNSSSSLAPLAAAAPGSIAYGSLLQQETATFGVPGGGSPSSSSSPALSAAFHHHLASIIPTPGLTCSSTCGTTGVRCAADALFSTSGQGQVQSLRPSTGPGAAASATTPSYLIQDDYPNLLPLPFQPMYSPAALAGYNPTCTPGVFYYQVAHGTDTVFKIGTCPLAVMKAIPVCSAPLQIQSAPDGSTEIVTCYNNAVSFIDTATDKVTTLPTPLYYPNGIDISPDGSTAYISSFIDSPPVIFSINLATRQLNPQTLTVNAYPQNIFLTPDGAQLWVVFYQSSSVYVIDTLSMTVAATISVPGTPDGIAFTPDGTRAYVGILGGTVSVIDTATLTQLASIPVADQPTGILVSKDGSRVYVDSAASTNPMFSVIDVATNKVIGTYPQIGAALGFIIFN